MEQEDSKTGSELVEESGDSHMPSVVNNGIEKLEEGWKILLENSRKEQKTQESIILSRTYTLQGHTIHVELDNSIQMDFFKTIKNNWQAFLQKYTGVSDLLITASLAPDKKKNQGTIYTNADRWQYLKEKYPLLDKLKDMLGLDLED